MTQSGRLRRRAEAHPDKNSHIRGKLESTFALRFLDLPRSIQLFAQSPPAGTLGQQ
jgi:hypothetical protein